MSFWETEELVGTVNKPNGEQIQIRKVSKKAKEYLDIRAYYMADDDEWHPGKGICIPHECCSDVFNILDQIRKEEGL